MEYNVYLNNLLFVADQGKTEAGFAVLDVLHLNPNNSFHVKIEHENDRNQVYIKKVN